MGWVVGGQVLVNLLLTLLLVGALVSKSQPPRPS